MVKDIQEIASLNLQSMTEIWKPVDYDTANGMSFQDAPNLFKQIQSRTTETNVIFEIGCGSGNITNLLSNNIKYEKIVACDISEEMIDFATKTYKKNKKIEYLVQDFGKDWDELDERIRKLEGSVDVVFSSYAMHLISNKKNAFKNVHRLLKKGGLCCINIPAILFFNEEESENKYNEREEFLNWMPKDKQFELFNNIITEVGMEILESETAVREWTFPSYEEFSKLFIPVSQAYANHVISQNAPENIRNDLLCRYEKLFLNFICEKRGVDIKKIRDKNDKSVKVYTDRFRFICQK